MRKLGAILTIALCACAPQESIESACESLVLDYAYYRDLLDAERIAELFADDATMSIRGEVFSGRAAIKKRIQDTSDDPATRHLMSTIRIFPVDSDRATGVSYVTVYLGPRGKEMGPSPVEGFAAIGEYHDSFVRTADGWKIASREFRPAFVYEDGP
jgi:ketosteroid isomerase-like protein